MNESFDPNLDSNQLDEIRLMKFAGGELGRDGENSFLLNCEAEPERWREVALALIEERRLTAVLSANQLVPVATPAESNPRRGAGLGWLATAACLGAIVGAGLMPSEQQPEPVAAAPPTNRYVVIEPGMPAPPPITPVTTAVLPWFDQEDYEVIKQHGYRLEEEPVFYLVSDEQGRQITIPSKNIKLTHVGR